MTSIDYIDGTSGSSGNCHLLSIETLRTVVLLDLGVPYKTVDSYLKEIDFDIAHIVICVTHEHADHWKNTTYQKLKTTYDDVQLMFRKYPTKGKEGIRYLHDFQTSHFKLIITQHNFSHGSTKSSIYRLKLVDTDKKKVIYNVMYGTDLDPTNANAIATSVLFNNMDLMLIEANYDDAVFLDYIMNPSKFISYGYDVSKGFARHLSKQQAQMIVDKQKPKAYMFVHKSSRFYGEDADNDSE